MSISRTELHPDGKLYRSFWPTGEDGIGWSVMSHLYRTIDGACLEDGNQWFGDFDTEEQAELAADRLDEALGGWITLDEALATVDPDSAARVREIIDTDNPLYR